MKQDIRWEQRFDNLQRAFSHLKKAVEQKQFSELEAAGVIQLFEFTFELSWKTIKDYLQLQGISLNFPREILKEAFRTELIEDGHLWIKMLEKRNELTHTYNEEMAQRAVKTICNEYFIGIEQLYLKLKSLL